MYKGNQEPNCQDSAESFCISRGRSLPDNGIFTLKSNLELGVSDAFVEFIKKKIFLNMVE